MKKPTTKVPKKPTRTDSQKEAEKKKAREDPFNYQRKDPPIYNPITFAKYLLAKHQSRKRIGASEIPFRERYTDYAYGIPTSARLMQFRQDKEREIESEIQREAKRQFREESPKPVKSGYEFKILN